MCGAGNPSNCGMNPAKTPHFPENPEQENPHTVADQIGWQISLEKVKNHYYFKKVYHKYEKKTRGKNNLKSIRVLQK